MGTVSEQHENDNALQVLFQKFNKRFQINKLLRSVNAKREKGIPVYTIFNLLLGLVFTHKNFYTLLQSQKDEAGMGKDAVYRFLSNAKINWKRFIIKLSNSVISILKESASDDKNSVFVIDDTAYHRDRSNNAELLSCGYDHCEKRYYKGFTMLTLSWSDGHTLIPVDYRLLAASSDKNILCPSQMNEDSRTLASRRRIDAGKDQG